MNCLILFMSLGKTFRAGLIFFNTKGYQEISYLFHLLMKLANYWLSLSSLLVY